MARDAAHSLGRWIIHDKADTPVYAWRAGWRNTAGLIVGGSEARVHHAKWLEDVILAIPVERHPRHATHDLSQDLEVLIAVDVLRAGRIQGRSATSMFIAVRYRTSGAACSSLA